MPNLAEILKNQTVIDQIIRDWGYKNARLFKGVYIKDDDYIKDESHILNILVDEESEEPNKRMLELDLERLLNCKVAVSLEDGFDDEYKYKIKEAVSLKDVTALIAYFGNDWQFENLKLNENENSRQQQAYENLDFIKKSLLDERRKKRKREEDTTQLTETNLPAEELNSINEFENKFKNFSPAARKELYARLDKYKNHTPTGKPISGVS